MNFIVTVVGTLFAGAAIAPIALEPSTRRTIAAGVILAMFGPL
jgi:hypothetical protein